MKKTEINGIILAGGKSSRMGTDKALLKLNGKKIIEHIIEALKPNVNKIMIITNSDDYAQFGFPIYNDLEKGLGPVGGIYTGLTYSTTEINFVISCDLPFISSKMIAFIINNCEEMRSAVTIHENIVEPLCSIYLKSETGIFFNALIEKRLKMKDLLPRMNPQFINVDQILNSTSKEFTNVNTPEEYSQSKKIAYEHTS